MCERKCLNGLHPLSSQVQSTLNVPRVNRAGHRLDLESLQ